MKTFKWQTEGDKVVGYEPDFGSVEIQASCCDYSYTFFCKHDGFERNGKPYVADSLEDAMSKCNAGRLRFLSQLWGKHEEKTFVKRVIIAAVGDGSMHVADEIILPSDAIQMMETLKQASMPPTDSVEADYVALREFEDLEPIFGATLASQISFVVIHKNALKL